MLVGTFVTRTVYENRLGGYGFGHGRGRTDPLTDAQLRTVLDESLLPALLAGAGTALAVAAMVAWIVGSRLLRPLDQVRAATRSMAAGDYTVEVPIPAEAELASLAADVNRLGDHLATVEMRRSHLLGEVTHELRTPIALIRGRMEAVLDGVVAPTDELFVSVADEAARMQRLVDDLVLLSRADEGTLEIAEVELDLAEVASAAAQRLRPQFDHMGVTLSVGESNRPSTVLGDADRIVQVLTNLLGNALGHTPAGGTVRVEPGGDDGSVWIDVVDTGTGVAPDDIERIFERFARGSDEAPPGRHTRPSGRGIGLTIARSIARAHGGDVVARSLGRGRGATFRLTLPRC